jgi:hypothetical protein
MTYVLSIGLSVVSCKNQSVNLQNDLLDIILGKPSPKPQDTVCITHPHKGITLGYIANKGVKLFM